MTVAQLLTSQPYSPKSTGETVGRHPLNFYESPSWFTTELLRHVPLQRFPRLCNTVFSLPLS